MNIVRSIFAVLAGYLLFAASSVGLFLIMARDPHAPTTTGFMVFSMIYGAFFAAVGGFVAALIAGRLEFEHSLAVSGMIAVVGAASLLARPAGESMWTQLAALLIMAPSAMLGGYLRAKQIAARKA